MSTLKKLLIAAFILIMIGLIGSILTVNSLFSEKQLLKNDYIINEEYDDVYINVNNMAIELSVTEEKETKIVTSMGKEYKTDVNVTDNTLNVTIKDPESFRMTIPNINFLKETPTVAIYLPEEKYKRVNVNSSNGIIIAKDLQAEDVSIKTINGLIKLESIDSGTTTVINENGKIHLQHISGDLKGETTNGMITYNADNIDQNINFKTVNGLISIDTDEQPTNVTFDLFVELGQIDVFGSKENNIVFGDGENTIKLTTELGKVTVK